MRQKPYIPDFMKPGMYGFCVELCTELHQKFLHPALQITGSDSE